MSYIVVYIIYIDNYINYSSTQMTHSNDELFGRLYDFGLDLARFYDLDLDLESKF